MPDTYKPTEAMASAAKRAKKMRDSQPPSNQGMTRTGLERMNQLINREPLSLEAVKRMYSFFSRHEVDKQSDSWKKGDSKAEQAWLGWGGDPGFTWSKRIIEQAEKTREANMVKEEDGKWFVYDEAGTKKLSKGYATKEEADKRLGQIEYFKREGNERAQFVRAVNRSQIQKHDKGWTIRDVVPVIDDIVMNRGLYPAEDLEVAYNGMDGVPAPIGHPKNKDGEFISAMRGEGLRDWFAGVTAENPRKSGDKYLVDFEINESKLMTHEDGPRLVDALNSGESIHVSTGLMLRREESKGESRGKPYDWIARDMTFDHIAILLDEPGAATPEDGVGIMANSSEMIVNLDKYEANSASLEEKKELIGDAIMRRFASGSDCYAWLRSTYDDHVIYSLSQEGMPNELFKIGYKVGDSGVELVGEPEKVKEETTYIPVLNWLLDNLPQWMKPGYNANHAQSMPTFDSGVEDMNEEQVKQLVANEMDDMKKMREEMNAMMKRMDEMNGMYKDMQNEMSKYNEMAKKMKANEDAEKAKLVEQINKATGTDTEELNSLEVNQLRTMSKCITGGSAIAVNGALPTPSDEYDYTAGAEA